MTQPPETPVWLLWILPVLGLLGAAWAALRWFFSTVSREELRETVREIDKPQELRHQENLGKFDEVFARLRKVEESQARTEGMLLRRYPNLPGKR